MKAAEYERPALPTESENPTDPVAASHVEAEYPAKVILVAVGLGEASRAALRRADKLAHGLGLGLRLVHAAAEGVPPPFQTPGAQPGAVPRVWLDKVRETLQEWAASMAGVQLPLENLRVTLGEPAEIILREAAAPEVALVVVGNSRGESDSLSMLHELLRCCRRPLLVVGPGGHQPVVIAATDCAVPSLPVLRQGWYMAAALGDQLVVVHNVDTTASQYAERFGMPFSTELADVVAERSREWLETKVSFGHVIITRAPSNARGVLSLARALATELVVVGVKPVETAPHRTADLILDHARCSVMFVPLASDGTALSDLLINEARGDVSVHSDSGLHHRRLPQYEGEEEMFQRFVQGGGSWSDLREGSERPEKTLR